MLFQYVLTKYTSTKPDATKETLLEERRSPDIFLLSVEKLNERR